MTMIVQASVTSRFLECYATSAANLRGAKQRKKVRFTTAFGGARGGAKYALRVSSATNGLMYLLMAAGLQKSNILTTPLSFGGTIAGALALDCRFYFAKINDSTLNIDVDSITNILDSNPCIKAIVATEFAGNSYDMEALHYICEQRGIWHFVDSAQVLGYNYGISNIADYKLSLFI